MPIVLPLLKIGFNKTFAETTNLSRCVNELVTLEYGEVSNVKRLQAAHVLFTALEYSNDSIEIRFHFNKESIGFNCDPIGIELNI